eukprot:TRINITY_DN56859_c0_g1_i1.p1 TRINITY_DN56859_c0_g1~~TRINITY_DN56859_c0_g1_i1.p1  ORF type:complete len:170 (+),score=23.26 TRINITY_DN56859_c0_g1_i1:55-510(+)
MYRFLALVFSLSNTVSAVEYMHVLLTEDKNISCCQIPKIMMDHTVFCHGPYSSGSLDCWQEVDSRPWQAGSCHDLGYGGPTVKGVANVTKQTDMFTCKFTKWDFDHMLPEELSMHEFRKDTSAELEEVLDKRKGTIRLVPRVVQKEADVVV